MKNSILKKSLANKLFILAKAVGEWNIQVNYISFVPSLVAPQFQVEEYGIFRKNHKRFTKQKNISYQGKH